MKRTLTTIVAQSILLSAALAQQTHLDIAVPERLDTDLSGLVKSVDKKTSWNVSGKFEREHQEYDRVGNLLNKTNWDPEGKCLNTQTNYYSKNGNFERQLYMDYEDGFTNNWEVILNPDSHQIAMKKETGAAAVYTYSPAGYLINYRYVDSDKNLRSASSTKRDEKNRRKEYTKMDDGKKPLYTYWFKWKDEGIIDRERQRYRQEKGERLHVYDYLKTDEQGNWLQRLMVRYDIGGKKKEKVYERLTVRSIEYFEEEEPVDTGTPDATSTNATIEASFPESSNEVTTVESTNVTAVATPATDDPEVEEHAASKEEPEAIQKELNAGFSYTFDDISEKLVVVTCKNTAGQSTGSGFVAKMDGKTYIFTNQHTILGTGQISFITASGGKLHPRKIELSTTRDIARLLLADGMESFEISSTIPMDAAIGVFGSNNSDEAEKELYGQVTGVGAEIAEVSAEFISGNSGSPVLNIDQKVLGIASYVRESNTHAMKEGTKFENRTRRFCYRLAGNQWKPVNWKKYNEKYGNSYHQNRMFTDGIIELFINWGDTPMERVSIKENPEQSLISWTKSHNAIIGKHRSGPKKRFASKYSESLKQLSESCSSRARKIRMFSEQRELTGFLREEFDGQASTLDYAAKILARIGNRAQDYR